MRGTVGILVIALALTFGAGSVHGQMRIGSPISPYHVQSYYNSPGSYGTTYGVPGYGLRRTYSTFASPYGAGYGYGYAPSTYLPGPYGIGLWKPAGPANRYVWRTPYYGTYAIPSAPRNLSLPPFGVYAPGFGPGVPPNLYGR